MNMSPHILTGREEIVSLRDLGRASKASLKKGIRRVIKGKESVGYFIPEYEMEIFWERKHSHTPTRKEQRSPSEKKLQHRKSWGQKFQQSDSLKKRETPFTFSNTFDSEEWQWK